MIILEDLACFWRTIIVVVTPLVLLPLPIIHTETESRCAYVLIIMAVYWLTEALPLPVTALIPIVLLPALAVVPASQVSINYIKDVTMVFFGGLIMAATIEHCNLHKRISLKAILLMGTTPRWLLLGFMLPTWFLSMWISNTATTAMMIAVAEATIQQLKQGLAKRARSHRLKNKFDSEKNANLEGINNPGYASTDDVPRNSTEMGVINGKVSPVMSESDVVAEMGDMEDPEYQAAEKKLTRFSKALCLAVAYAANIGGVATLTGTPPNLVLINIINEFYRDNNLGDEPPVSYTKWMGFALPISIVCLIFAWIWLVVVFMGPRSLLCKGEQESVGGDDSILEKVREDYNQLGPFRFAEVANVVFFLIMVALWLTRSPGFVDGWGSLFSKGYVSDSSSAILIAIMLFAFPSQVPMLPCFRKKGEKPERREALITWEVVAEKCPWSAIFILGGGFALADACTKSGLSVLIGEQLHVLKDWPQWTMVLLVVALIAALTEVTSNTATTNLMLPILAELAVVIGVHPLFLMLPATVAASFAFMLPVATPPNAVVFSYRHLTVADMAKTGIVLNIFGILIVTLAMNTYGIPMFNLNELPWETDNLTTTLPP